MIVAEALFGASFLGLAVDYYAKRDLLEELVRDAAHLLIGFEMPKLVQSRIVQIMKTTLVRHDWTIRYRIEPDGKRVRVHIESSFILRAYAGKAVKYQALLEFEQTERARVEVMRCDSTDSDARYHLSKLTPRTDERVDRFSGTEITIQEGQDYPVSAKYSVEAPHEGSDVFVFGGPAVNVTVITEDNPDYDLDLAPTNDVDVIRTPNRWEFRRAFLEGQHLRVRWMPREHTPLTLLDK
jgi:hypothetical protein